jgi:hypothetical protein
MQQLVERRRNRSDNRSEALELCLEACRTKGNFDVVVVADEDGLLVGSSKNAGGHDVSVVAAVLPERTRHPERLSSILFKSTGHSLFVGAIGGGREPQGKLVDAMHGARRILGTPLVDA